MKKLTIIAGSALAIALAATSVFADSTMSSTSSASMSANSMSSANMAAPSKASTKPCKTIRTACMAAGYAKGGKNGKSLMKDCMKPLLAGQQVQGVNVNANDMQACKTKMNQKHAMIKKNMQKKMSNGSNSTTSGSDQ